MPFGIKCDIIIKVIIKDVIERSGIVNIDKGDTLLMKKQHPCGDNRMLVLRSGMDFKLRCLGCGREFMIPRSKAEKSIKSVIKPEES